MNAGNVTGVKFTNNVTATFMVVNNTTITATVPAGAVTGPITISKAGCPDLQTASFTVCPNPASSITIDDGSVESANSFGNGAYYVNRLTPAAYPATLSQVSILWAGFQGFPQGTAINVVAGGNPAGTQTLTAPASRRSPRPQARWVSLRLTRCPIRLRSLQETLSSVFRSRPIRALRSRLTLTHRQTALTLQATGQPLLLSRVQETS